MTTDFRTLCIELTDCLEKADWPLRHRYVFRQWIDIARAALADEPAVPEGREPASVTGQPSDGELLDLLPQGNESGFWLPKGLPSDWVDGEFIAPPKAIIAFARDVLELWGNPTPQPPADGEVAELTAWLRMQGEAQKPGPKSLLSTKTKKEMHANGSRLIRAAELLQRQVVVPVAVSVRLPGPEDCDAEGRCWAWNPDPPDNDEEESWVLQPRDWIASPWTTHWLPAHALPLPEVGE